MGEPVTLCPTCEGRGFVQYGGRESLFVCPACGGDHAGQPYIDHTPPGDDPVDYPCSAAFRGFDPGPTEHERAMEQHMAWIERAAQAMRERVKAPGQALPSLGLRKQADPSPAGPKPKGKTPQKALNLPRPQPAPHGIDLGPSSGSGYG